MVTPLGISKSRFWNNYKRDTIKFIVSQGDREFVSHRQSIGSKIARLKKELEEEKDFFKREAIKQVIKSLEALK